LLYQNGIFFPLIIINGIFGTGNALLASLFVFIALQPSFVFSTYTLFFRKNLQAQNLSWRRVINPVLVTTLVGMIIGLLAINRYVPVFIFNIITIVGAMATPLFMLILGGNVYNDIMLKEEGKRRFYFREILSFIFVKNLLYPAVFLGLVILLRLDNTIAFIILIQASVPPITAIPIFAERSGGNRAVASQFVVASFIFSIISIPLMVYLYSLFFSLPVK